jgi:multidrug resistance efflux pump
MSSTRRSLTSATICCKRKTRIFARCRRRCAQRLQSGACARRPRRRSGREKAAALKAAQINLDYTNIVSPVDGTVVSRNVTAGQTVAASFQTPTLFLIATDLTKMQVDTNVSESDIAGAVEGANASFTVDAFPKRTFQGRVAQVRQAPVSVQNVITYDAVITVDNPDLAAQARDDGDRQDRHGPIAECA